MRNPYSSNRYGLYSYGRRRQRIPAFVFLAPLLALMVLGAFQYVRPVPGVTVTTLVTAQTVLGEPRGMVALPPSGAAAVHVKGLGTIAATPDDTPRPIASVTKTMTAYVILKYHPLAPGERGPTVTITQADVTAYLNAAREDQSVVPVAAGQVYTLYDMLRLLLIPSANNFADILAVWDAGSLPAFVAKMNAEAAALGMTHTTYADASGFSPRSVSTARDQLILAMAAMENPVFAEIVGQAEATVPNVGRVFNTNPVLGQEGIIGIKTGFTDEAGGCLLFAARREAAGQTYEIFGIVLGQPSRPLAFDAARRLVAAVAAGTQRVPAMAAGRVIATLEAPWGAKADIVASEDVSMLLWPGMALESALAVETVSAPLAEGTTVGALSLRLGEQTRTVPLTLAEPLRKPSLWWRLTRI